MRSQTADEREFHLSLSTVMNNKTPPLFCPPESSFHLQALSSAGIFAVLILCYAVFPEPCLCTADKGYHSCCGVAPWLFLQCPLVLAAAKGWKTKPSLPVGNRATISVSIQD